MDTVQKPSINLKKSAVIAILLTSVFATGAFSAGGDIAYVPVVVNVTATVKIEFIGGSCLLIGCVSGMGETRELSANRTDTLLLRLPGFTSISHNPQRQSAIPTIASGAGGKVFVRLSARSYTNAKISLFSINGKRILDFDWAATERLRSISRNNIIAGAYLLSVRGADGDAFTSRLIHRGGNMDISVSSVNEESAFRPQQAKEAADETGNWRITVKATAPGYRDSTNTFNPETGMNPKWVITLRDTTGSGGLRRRSGRLQPAGLSGRSE